MTDGVENMDKLAEFLLVDREIATEDDWNTARDRRRQHRRNKEARRRASQRDAERAAFMRGERWV